MPPPLFFTNRKSDAPHLRTWAQLRAQIQSGAYGLLWTSIERQAKLDLHKPELTPSSMPPGRLPDQAAHANPDFTITSAVCQRILRAALLFRVTGDKAYRESCLLQMEVLFDPAIWPDWRDQAHACQQHPADLRTGWLARDIALVYNWLHSALTPAQRRRVLAGLDRRGIQPYMASLPQNPFWLNRPTNWMTCVVGGLGICGMALGEDHPDAKTLVEISRPKMKSCLAVYGREGEFCESPGYAGSLRQVVKYYDALRCIEPDAPNHLTEFPFPQMARWVQYLALGPRRIAALGDGHPETPPYVAHFSSIAAATRDPVIQGLAQHYRPKLTQSDRNSNLGYIGPDVFELIWFDPTLPAKKPGADYPRHATFKDHAACFSSRTDWKTSGSDCVVYGKAGREPAHAHCDAGQVCIDAYGERLIRDHGLPAGGYPEDYFGQNRTQYYNASVLGHNLLTINNQEHPDVATNGHFLSEGALPDGMGAYWIYDLKACNPHAASITRAVFHFQPNIVVVIDEARTDKRATFRQRWHTAKPVKIKADGTFKFTEGKACLSARIHSYGRAAPIYESGRHVYHAPYDRNRLGEKLKQPREPFVDTVTKGKSARVLTAFATGSPPSRLPSWQEENGMLSFDDKQRGHFSVKLQGHALHYNTPQGTGSFDLSMMKR